MPAFRPSPERMPEDHAHLPIRRTRFDVAVIVRPPTDDRVEQSDQILLLCGAIRTNVPTHLFQEGVHVLLEGVIRSLPPYLRRFCPKKSKPCSICVMQVFSGESCKPRSSMNRSTSGLTSVRRHAAERPAHHVRRHPALSRGHRRRRGAPFKHRLAEIHATSLKRLSKGEAADDPSDAAEGE